MNQVTPLLDRTRYLIRNRSRSVHLKHIAADTGLTFGWLQAFLADQSNDYGIVKVQKLHDYLLAKQTEVV